MSAGENRQLVLCPRCKGVGSYLADCTTFGPDCACNGSRVQCADCNSEGELPADAAWQIAVSKRDPGGMTE